MLVYWCVTCVLVYRCDLCVGVQVWEELVVKVLFFRCNLCVGVLVCDLCWCTGVGGAGGEGAVLQV